MKHTTMLIAAMLVFLLMTGFECENTNSSSDDVQRQAQEKVLKEGTAQTGLPSITNFRERKLLKQILEMRDQANLVTYTYLENMNPVIVVGHTALGGKLTYLGQTIGFGIPYATQYTNPQKDIYYGTSSAALPQADPNGLFSPASAEGTWVLMKNPTNVDVSPVYIEPRVVTIPWKLEFDK